ncbi:sce7726 family protein [Thalassospira sp. NFXS8]|uniref:sce7726 family protein n=1 Tax=Thalassospira sp. NFXS8 TaxID=2819093 RepID=UPI0032DECFA5
MRDIDVRQALERQVLRDHNADPNTLVVHELGVLGGASRVDIAVVNGSLHGIEIKSDKDTLGRLSEQSRAYSRIFDKVTIVCGERHFEKVEECVPAWWGIKVAVSGPRGGIEFSQERFPKLNRSQEPEALASLLWKDEALDVLEKHGVAKGVRSKNKAAIYRRLAECLSVDILRDAVRDRLKTRVGWRSDR